MIQAFESGDKISYKLFDEKGKEHWLKGVIHGVKRAEDPATNAILSITYLIDTGRHVAYSENVYNPRDREVEKRVSRIVKQGGTAIEAIHDVLKHPDLPNASQAVEVAREPEQIELSADFIRPLKA